MTEKQGVSGTREWSVASVNCAKGCHHGCYYCYARENAMRFKRIADTSEWLYPTVSRKLGQECKKYEGTVMFPTTHDITPQLLQTSYEVLINLLRWGNDVLIVSKPHLNCIISLCNVLEEWREQILWRFTIGCLDGATMNMWEPHAPLPVERLACLHIAEKLGYKTSVSMEPMLDPRSVVHDFPIIARHATESVWLGKMNHVKKRVLMQRRLITQNEKGETVVMGILQDGVPPDAIEALEKAQSDENIKRIYEALKDEPKVRWKESIKKIVGLPLETEAGTDR